MPKESIIVANIEKTFTLQINAEIETVNDLSVKNKLLLILTTKSFYLYDMVDQVIQK